MDTLTLKSRFQTNGTLVSNTFIDRYMASANGEFVKVYLFLLRHTDDMASSLRISDIADCLDNTEKDVIRAFRYWESQGLLHLELDGEGRLQGLELLPLKPASPESSLSSSAPLQAPGKTESVKKAEPSSPAPDIAGNVKAEKEIKSLLFIAEQYMGKTLSHSDVESITYFYTDLGMSAELIEYLIESCVENDKKSMHYIRKVALSWQEEGITTREQARQRSASYNKNCYTVLNAFGIKNRAPAESELSYIRKWSNEMGFSTELIQEACNRTMAAIHQPSFEYADVILEKWQEGKVRHLKDIAALDEAFQKERSIRKSSSPAVKTNVKNMNNFERRNYDMDSLEAKLLQNQ